MRPLPVLSLCLSLTLSAFASTPRLLDEARKVEAPGVSGTLLEYPAVKPARLAPRSVFVWLPPSYGSQPAKHYPVLYMQDGQNLFQPGRSFGGEEWGIDEALLEAFAEGSLREALVVGIANTHQRAAEYLPRKAALFAQGTPHWTRLQEDGRFLQLEIRPESFLADDYLAFLVSELKPAIDAAYRTLPGREHTLIAGSSLGGLISLYAICEYPAVFGAAACLSTHWTAGDGLLLPWLAQGHLPAADSHRLYFDFGTQTLDQPYESYQLRIDALLRQAGYREGENWRTLKFPGADHSEKAWRERAKTYLGFLLGPSR